MPSETSRTFEIHREDETKVLGVTIKFQPKEDGASYEIKVPENAPEELIALSGKVYADLAEAEDAVTGVVSTLEG